MKKFLVLLLGLSLIFLVAVVATAEGNSGSIYLDLAVNGSSKDSISASGPIPQNPSVYDLNFDGTSGYTVGGDYIFGSFKAVMEYSSDSFKNTQFTSGQLISSNTAKSQFDYTANITLAKVGYRVMDHTQFSLDLMAGYLGLSVTGIGYSNTSLGVKSGDMNYTNEGPMAAIDFDWSPNQKLTIIGTYGTTFGASSSMTLMDKDLPTIYHATIDSDSSSLTAYRIKALYMFWDNIGVSLSYSAVASSISYTYKTALGKEKVNNDADYSGVALGVTYKF